MAKKVRRVRKKRTKTTKAKAAVSQPAETKTAVPAKPSQVKTAKTAKKKSSRGHKPTTEQEFRQEYAYVLKDLRTTFILATVMFALLIALNLFLSLT